MSVLALSCKESDVRIRNISQSLPHKMAGNSWHRYDTKKLRHCHLCIQCEHSHLIQCVRLRPNSISLIRCGFVVQQALQQNPQQTYNKSNNWSSVFTASCGTNSLTARSTGTVHTSAKARLTSLAIWIGIRIRIRIRDPDTWSGSPSKFNHLLIGPLPTFSENFM